MAPLKVMTGSGLRTVPGYTINQAGLDAAPALLRAIRDHAYRIEAARATPRPAPGPRPPAPGLVSALIMSAFMAEPGQARYSADLARRTGVPENTLRPALLRMTRDGLVSSCPEPAGDRPGTRGRPRHLYSLTPIGEKAGPAIVDAARQQLTAIGGLPRHKDPGPER